MHRDFSILLIHAKDQQTVKAISQSRLYAYRNHVSAGMCKTFFFRLTATRNEAIITQWGGTFNVHLIRCNGDYRYVTSLALSIMYNDYITVDILG